MKDIMENHYLVFIQTSLTSHHQTALADFESLTDAKLMREIKLDKPILSVSFSILHSLFAAHSLLHYLAYFH